jgi:two-component system, NtrC family, response regulator GlrR
MDQPILIVDDDSDIRSLVRRVLTGAGYAVLTAPDGEAALAVVDAEHPCLVITDVQMPRRDGRALIAHLRHEDPLLPILVVSAVAEQPDLDGIPILAKPFSLADLLAKVQQLLPQANEYQVRAPFSKTQDALPEAHAS